MNEHISLQLQLVTFTWYVTNFTGGTDPVIHVRGLNEEK